MPGFKPQIVHVSADFPDPFVSAKTPVIRSLLDLTQAEFGHRVVSLNRVGPGLGAMTGSASGGGWPIRGRAPESRAFAYGEAVQYHAPGSGILHRTMLNRVGDWLAARLAGDPPQLLVGHKLTIEGIAVARAARQLGLPYGITIQGNTDTRILRARPDLRSAVARIFHEAAIVFPFAPWALDEVERKLGRRAGPVVRLPCPTDLDAHLPPVVPGDGLVSVFHLRHHQTKNLAGLIAAHRRLNASGAAPDLAIIGGGDDRDLATCRAIARRQPGVTFAGALDRAQLHRRLNRATGFVLPSRRESFGLVFIEALFAGLPVIYPRGAAIDGYFDEFPFAIRVDPQDDQAIAAAMQQVVEEEAVLKAAVQAWQSSDHARQFTRPMIAAQFARGLRLGCA